MQNNQDKTIHILVNNQIIKVNLKDGMTFGDAKELAVNQANRDQNLSLDPKLLTMFKYLPHRSEYQNYYYLNYTIGSPV